MTKLSRGVVGAAAALSLLAASPSAAQSLDDDPAFALYRQAAEAFEAKDYGRAAALARDSLVHYPENLQAQYLLGQAALAEERWEEAAAAFRKVVALSRSAFAGHRELGTALAQAGHTERAIEAFEAALKLRPENEPVRLRLAFLQLQAGNRDAAFPQLRALADKGTKEPQVWAALGRLHYERGQLGESEQAFSRAATLGDDPKTWFNLGVVRLRLDDEKGARHAFERAARDSEIKAQATEQIARIDAARAPER